MGYTVEVLWPYHQCHTYPTSILTSVWFAINRVDTEGSSQSKLIITWAAKLEGQSYVGSSGLMLRYKIGSGGSWSSWKSLVGNGNKEGFRGADLFRPGAWYYNSAGYKANFSGYPESERTHFVGRYDYNYSLTVYFEIARSSDMAWHASYPEQSLTLSIPKKEYYWDINTFIPADDPRPDNTQHAVYFNEYIDGVKKNGNQKIANEMPEYDFMPKGTIGSIGELEPITNIWEITGVFKEKSNSIREVLTADSNGRYSITVGGWPDDYYKIVVTTDYKQTGLTLEAEGGSVNQHSEKFKCETNRLNKINVPIRLGYEFLGWYDANDILVYYADGTARLGTDYWNTEGKYQGVNDLTLYAKWKARNVAHIKDENNKWQLALTYVKNEKNEWCPAITYIKDDNNDWKQSIK